MGDEFAEEKVKWRFKQCFGEQRSLETIQEGDMLTGMFILISSFEHGNPWL